jgi:ubiquitin-like protein ATG12
MSTTTADASKVKVHFVAVGSAPILKRTKYQISADQPFAAVTTFLRKLLKLNDGGGASLFLYIQSCFVPGPEEVIGDIQKSFGVREELVIHYSIQEAWG